LLPETVLGVVAVLLACLLAAAPAAERDTPWVRHTIDDSDVVLSDRKGANRGCYWLENPGPGSALIRPWQEHLIGGQGREVMFLTLADLDCDGLQDVLAAAKPREVLWLRRKSTDGKAWEPRPIRMPDAAGTAKAVAVGDIDRDGQLEVVFSCEGAENKSGIMWLSRRASNTEHRWSAHDISGRDGIKHDLVELLDLDGDGDLDVLTCEEAENLGLFWHENPASAKDERECTQMIGAWLLGRSGASCSSSYKPALNLRAVRCQSAGKPDARLAIGGQALQTLARRAARIGSRGVVWADVEVRPS
jgi:hypothetical protein